MPCIQSQPCRQHRQSFRPRPTRAAKGLPRRHHRIRRRRTLRLRRPCRPTMRDEVEGAPKLEPWLENVLYDIPLRGSPTVFRTPLGPIFIDAPRPPSEVLIPNLLKFSRMQGRILTERRNRNPTVNVSWRMGALAYRIEPLWLLFDKSRRIR